MINTTRGRNAIAAVVVACAVSACSNEAEFAGADTQTVVSRERAEPMTIAGCLRAGTGTNTFVLTTAQTAGQSQTATYNLTGAQGVNLQEHVGQQVQVTGTLTAETQMTSQGTTTIPQEKAEGTSGTPVVQTKTEVDVKRLDVTSVTPSGQRCEV
jgi:hypothetical protein